MVVAVEDLGVRAVEGTEELCIPWRLYLTDGQAVLDGHERRVGVAHHAAEGAVARNVCGVVEPTVEQAVEEIAAIMKAENRRFRRSRDAVETLLAQ